MELWGTTNRGVVREENQDAFQIEAFSAQEMFGVVCDGMGGARAGKVASSMAVDTFVEQIRSLWADGESRAAEDLMLRSAAAANESVHIRSNNDPACYGMGTTIVAVYLKEEHATVLNEGDSRAYHITSDTITQITRDHSLVADLVHRGELTPDQARVHPHKNLITRALGAESELRADIFELDVRPGEYIVLCSDGLSNVVSDQEILYEVLFGGPEDECCKRLLDIAITRGAPDNVTVVLAKC